MATMLMTACSIEFEVAEAPVVAGLTTDRSDTGLPGDEVGAPAVDLAPDPALPTPTPLTADDMPSPFNDAGPTAEPAGAPAFPFGAVEVAGFVDQWNGVAAVAEARDWWQVPTLDASTGRVGSAEAGMRPFVIELNESAAVGGLLDATDQVVSLLYISTDDNDLFPDGLLHTLYTVDRDADFDEQVPVMELDDIGASPLTVSVRQTSYQSRELRGATVRFLVVTMVADDDEASARHGLTSSRVTRLLADMMAG